MDKGAIELNFRRPLIFRTKDKTFSGELYIPDILFDPTVQKWRCRWSITLIKEDLGKGLRGDDPLQALCQVLNVASELIKKSGYPDLVIWWQHEGDCGGLERLFPK